MAYIISTTPSRLAGLGATPTTSEIQTIARALNMSEATVRAMATLNPGVYATWKKQVIGGASASTTTKTAAASSSAPSTSQVTDLAISNITKYGLHALGFEAAKGTTTPTNREPTPAEIIAELATTIYGVTVTSDPEAVKKTLVMNALDRAVAKLHKSSASDAKNKALGVAKFRLGWVSAGAPVDLEGIDMLARQTYFITDDKLRKALYEAAYAEIIANAGGGTVPPVPALVPTGSHIGPSSTPGGSAGDNTMLYVGGAAVVGVLVLLASRRR